MPIVMLIFFEYSKYYSKTPWSLWNYCWNERNTGVGGANNYTNYSMKNSKSFNY